MMSMQVHSASGAASAHRYNFASSTTVFKTRIQPCRIVVRADIEKSMASEEDRPQFSENCKTSGNQQSQILSPDGMNLRFTEN